MGLVIGVGVVLCEDDGVGIDGVVSDDDGVVIGVGVGLWIEEECSWMGVKVVGVGVGDGEVVIGD